MSRVGVGLALILELQRLVRDNRPTCLQLELNLIVGLAYATLDYIVCYLGLYLRASGQSMACVVMEKNLR